MSRTYHYGITGLDHIKRLTEKVCDVLGYGSNGTADLQIIETTAAETQCGLYKDPTPDSAGFGLTQFDRVGFLDTKMRTRNKDYLKILHAFNIDITHVAIEDLADNPLLAIIFTRLKYKLRPEPIPKSLIGRAHYWKQWWNTYHPNAKGTPQHYLASAERHLNLEEEYYDQVF